MIPILLSLCLLAGAPAAPAQRTPPQVCEKEKRDEVAVSVLILQTPDEDRYTLRRLFKLWDEKVAATNACLKRQALAAVPPDA